MSDQPAPPPPQNGQKRTITALALFGVIMFGFGFALVPLYKLVCQVGGVNGIASNSGRVADPVLALAVDKSRQITVEFDATINAGLPWEFRPMVKKLKVYPGAVNEVSYYARNNSDQTIVGQAIPGVTPWQVTEYFNKTECFCFTNQTLAPGEAREMPLRFVISPRVPEEYATVTLSYTFMNTDRERIQQTMVHKDARETMNPG